MEKSHLRTSMQTLEETMNDKVQQIGKYTGSHLRTMFTSLEEKYYAETPVILPGITAFSFNKNNLYYDSGPVNPGWLDIDGVRISPSNPFIVTSMINGVIVPITTSNFFTYDPLTGIINLITPAPFSWGSTLQIEAFVQIGGSIAIHLTFMGYSEQFATYYNLSNVEIISESIPLGLSSYTIKNLPGVSSWSVTSYYKGFPTTPVTSGQTFNLTGLGVGGIQIRQLS